MKKQILFGLDGKTLNRQVLPEDLLEQTLPDIKLSHGIYFIEISEKGKQSRVEKLEVAPNPFNRSTMINFILQKDKKVSLIIYDLNGKQIKVLLDEMKESGDHRIEWDARNESGKLVPAGIYYTRIIYSGFMETKAMVVIH